MRTPTESQPQAGHERQSRGRRPPTTWLLAVALALAGCGEPSVRDLKNRRELEHC